ncbi:hypothetical protein ACFCV3_10795 [Kribbella sp. NPDC056345]|uniref:hypothetical protein n=1 Tax=Kribbella sp. NPDC056345 TaxID=3345789 RepID=UPI0035DEC360
MMSPGGADVRDVLVVHEMLRGELYLAAGLVLSVKPRVRSRAKVVCDHLDLLESLLRLHLEAAELLLWPKLSARAGSTLTATLPQLEQQHDHLGVLCERAARLQTSWRTDANFDTAADLVGVLGKLAGVWSSYVEVQERRVLPLVPDIVNDLEWREVLEYTLRGLPQTRLPVVFGMLDRHADPDIQRLLLSDTPAISRWLLRRFAPRLCASYLKKVYRDFSDRE